MFIPYTSDSVRFIGRFAPVDGAMTATAAGSYIEIAYEGDECVLHFDIRINTFPMPHLWIQVDGGVKTEVPLDRYLRIHAGPGFHTAKITYKGGKETLNRWYAPLQGKISFLGYEADAPAVLPSDNRKTIELVGDSITEGVLIDPQRYYTDDDQNNRPYEDDATATYAYLIAEGLGLRTLHMGYGAVGATRSGCGAVPKASEAYPYCFDGAPVTYGHPDYILINHGANDRGAPLEGYLADYRALLDVIRAAHPDAKIIALSAFCRDDGEKLKEMLDGYNEEKKDDILFVDGGGRIPLEPLHPLRDGHRIVAEGVLPILKEKLGL